MGMRLNSVDIGWGNAWGWNVLKLALKTCNGVKWIESCHKDGYWMGMGWSRIQWSAFMLREIDFWVPFWQKFGNIYWEGENEVSGRKTCPGITMSTTNCTCTGMGLNLGLEVDRPETRHGYTVNTIHYIGFVTCNLQHVPMLHALCNSSTLRCSSYRHTCLKWNNDDPMRSCKADFTVQVTLISQIHPDNPAAVRESTMNQWFPNKLQNFLGISSVCWRPVCCLTRS